MADNDEIVFFNMPDGSKVSNDPRFNPEDYEEGEDAGSYANMTAKELKAEAEKRDIDISGMTKKSEIVEALEADDAAESKE